uniref:Reverse transcriptase domain-containing protein n=1 Tax=Oreochromis aureus TaxID=47969 RepID=A0AAZ1XJK6_OREAU
MKDKAAKVSCLDNYRPIALASILSKVLERILFDRVSVFISSLDNQFGFKPKHGTDMCIYALKEIVSLYRAKNSSVLMCFIDTSKAFDRVNHRKLFDKLKRRGVPQYIVRILSYWYAHQNMQVKWGSSISAPFGVSNGVREGGILSPILFNLYVDDLSIQLRACNIGCILGKTLINHLMYADDLVVFSPSSAGLQDLLNVCTEYGVQYDIEYNAVKSAVLICRTKQDKQLNFPLFKLAQKTLEIHKKVKYLGHFITEQMNDDDDIYRQRCKLYVQVNNIARKFSFCSLPVKVALFKAYCTPLYTAPLWSSNKQRSMQKLHVAYNDAMRILCRIPRRGSASQMFVAVGVWTFKALLRKLMFNFRERLDQVTV